MNETTKSAKEIPVKLLVAVTLFLFAVFFFAYLAKVVVIGKQDLFDTNVFNFLSSYTTPFVVEIMKVITFFGSATFLLPAYVLLVLWLWVKEKQKRLALDVALVGLSLCQRCYWRILHWFFLGAVNALVA